MSEHYEVIDYNPVQTFEIEDAETIELIAGSVPGVKGDQGDPGSPGAPGSPGVPGVSGGSFHYATVLAINPWPINHGLGYYPSLGRCLDDANTVREPYIVHIDANNLELHFIGPTAGQADLS